MAAEYSAGSVQKYNGKWRGMLRYKAPATDKATGATVTDEEGNPVLTWHTVTKVFDVASYSGSNRGKAKAEDELKAWRASLVKADKEAEAEARRNSDANLTVAEYVAKFVEQRGAAGIIEPSALKDYRETARNRIAREGKGSIANIKVRDLRPEHVRAWETMLITCGRRDGKGYAPQTVIKSHRLLGEAMKQARIDGAITNDPMLGVNPPKKVRSNPNAVPKADAPDLVAQLDAIGGDNYTTIAARIAIFTGMRREEICALKWKDYDADARTIHVRRAIGSGPKGCGPRGTNSYVKDAKTDKRRMVPVPASLADSLDAWRASMLAECVTVGITGSLFGEQFIIGTPTKRAATNEDGFRAPDRVTQTWSTLSHKFGIIGTEGRVPTFHDLRHTYATITIGAGVDVKTVSSTLGHANAAMTLNIYASADPQAQQAAARTVDELLKPRQAEVLELPKTGTEDGR